MSNRTFVDLATDMDRRIDQLRAGLDNNDPRAVERTRELLLDIIPDMDAVCLETLLVGFQTYLEFCRQQAKRKSHV